MLDVMTKNELLGLSLAAICVGAFVLGMVAMVVFGLAYQRQVNELQVFQRRIADVDALLERVGSLEAEASGLQNWLGNLHNGVFRLRKEFQELAAPHKPCNARAQKHGKTRVERLPASCLR